MGGSTHCSLTKATEPHFWHLVPAVLTYSALGSSHFSRYSLFYQFHINYLKKNHKLPYLVACLLLHSSVSKIRVDTHEQTASHSSKFSYLSEILKLDSSLLESGASLIGSNAGGRGILYWTDQSSSQKLSPIHNHAVSPHFTISPKLKAAGRLRKWKKRKGNDSK